MKLTLQHVDGMRFLATAGAHTALVDAAPEDGGGGTAMSAPQLFAAAVGACILEFTLNSCRLHDTPVDRLSLELDYEEASQPRRLGALEVMIHLQPEPPADVKRRLAAIARHATLVTTLERAPAVLIHFPEEGELDADL